MGRVVDSARCFHLTWRVEEAGPLQQAQVQVQDATRQALRRHLRHTRRGHMARRTSQSAC